MFPSSSISKLLRNYAYPIPNLAVSVVLRRNNIKSCEASVECVCFLEEVVLVGAIQKGSRNEMSLSFRKEKKSLLFQFTLLFYDTDAWPAHSYLPPTR